MLRMVLVVFEVKRYKMWKWCGGGGAGGDEDELLQEESNLWAGMPRQSTLVNCAQTTQASFEKYHLKIAYKVTFEGTSL